MLAKAAVLLSFVVAIAGQDTGTLHVAITIADAAGVATPIPRVELLVSANPATGEPRRVRTSADGTATLALTPGSYIVELEQPVAFGGKGYSWTEVVTIAARRETQVALTAANAEIGPAPLQPERSGTTASRDAAVFSTWRDAVVEIWTPTAHATGFVIDGRGLIATSHDAISGATSVEVQFTTANAALKVPGTVVADDPSSGAAIVWIDPQGTGSAKVLDPGCARADRPVPASQDDVTTITAPMFRDKDEVTGRVSQVTPQAIFADLRLRPGDAGGPVFNDSGNLIGISVVPRDQEDRRAQEPWVVPIARACETIAAAATKLSGTARPASMRLPIEPAAQARPASDTNRSQMPPAALSSSAFDITLLTSALVTNDRVPGPRSDFGNWTEYVRTAPPVLLVRVSPQFEESIWKTLARGAAATQGMRLPPLKSFSANFLRLQAFCGDAEVLPIHPFIIERQVAGKTIREGLYVFDPAAFGPPCTSVRLSMYSEKDPQKADVKTIDAKLFQQLANSLQ